MPGKFITIIVVIVLLSSCINEKKQETEKPAEQNNVISYPSLPTGWRALDSANAVILGSKSFLRNSIDSTDFVIIANLQAGASINLPDSNYNNNFPSPVFYRFSVSDTGNSFWNLYHTQNSFAMANLQFFENAHEYSDTAPVCYPLYYNGNYVSYGCNDSSCPDCVSNQSYAQRIVLISASGITIMNYPDTIPFNNYPIPSPVITAFVGNAPVKIPRSPDSFAGRTYIAAQGTNLILYTSPYANEGYVDSVLQQDFQVDSSNIVMFDGGGSTQMICNGKPYIISSDLRKVPSAISIQAAAMNSQVSETVGRKK